MIYDNYDGIIENYDDDMKKCTLKRNHDIASIRVYYKNS